MENNNVLSGDINCLREYRNLVQEHAEAVRMSYETEGEMKAAEKELNTARKALKDNIDSVVKKRREEASVRFDDEIGKDQDKLKKVKNQRNKAKDKGIKNRIKDETADLSKDNDNLKKEIRDAFKSERIPVFCSSDLYFALYMTKGIREILTCVITVVVMLLIFPFALYVILPFENLPVAPVLAITYFVVAALVILAYKMIGDRTRVPYIETLRSARVVKDKIASNKREMAKIAKSIKKDKNEEGYDLEGYDKKIKKLEADIDSTMRSKEDALKFFDESSKKDIIGEIESREMPKINELEDKYNAVTEENAKMNDKSKKLGLELASNYETYLGNEYSDTEKIDALLNIMETGRAATISEAIAEYNKQV